MSVDLEEGGDMVVREELWYCRRKSGAAEVGGQVDRFFIYSAGKVQRCSLQKQVENREI